MTAVEFLEEQLKDNRFLSAFEDEFNQAKEMEKQQIIDAYNIGFIYPIDIDLDTQKSVTGEQYYKKIFKK